jgi:hypothetical protein
LSAASRHPADKQSKSLADHPVMVGLFPVLRLITLDILIALDLFLRILTVHKVN